VEALKAVLSISQPEIFNTDQGTQFTSLRFTGTLEDRDIRISMDGRGRVFDNIFVERFWWSVKYEEVYRSAELTTKPERLPDTRRSLPEFGGLF
jgi:putative transposase